MKIAYFIPTVTTVYAARFIYDGYKEAFVDLGYTFKTITADDDLEEVLAEYEPDIGIISLNNYTEKVFNFKVLQKFRDKGMVLFTQIANWLPMNKVMGGTGLINNQNHVELIKNGMAGDIFFHWMEQDEPLMDGFEKTTGYGFETILVAANDKQYFNQYDDKYHFDINYVGSYLGDKKEFIKEHLLPLKKKYNVSINGSDWTKTDKLMGYIQKFAQYYKIKALQNIRDIKINIEQERKLYSSSTISLNIHNKDQRRLGTDFNERTLKIIACGGFEICDNIEMLRRYFKEDELVMAKDTKDWFEKIDFYIKNPDKRISIIDAGKKVVLKNHTYRNRVKQIISLYNTRKI
jgi:hypothetical protein